MNELQAWLASQHAGLRTFKAFQLKLAEFAARYPEQRAFCRLLDDIVGRHIEEYDEAPLPSAVAERAYQNLLQSVAYLDCQAAPAQQLGTLNRLAAFSLTH